MYQLHGTEVRAQRRPHAWYRKPCTKASQTRYPCSKAHRGFESAGQSILDNGKVVQPGSTLYGAQVSRDVRMVQETIYGPSQTRHTCCKAHRGFELLGRDILDNDRVQQPGIML